MSILLPDQSFRLPVRIGQIFSETTKLGPLLILAKKALTPRPQPLLRRELLSRYRPRHPLRLTNAMTVRPRGNKGARFYSIQGI